jgi:hypothetical protein
MYAVPIVEFPIYVQKLLLAVHTHMRQHKTCIYISKLIKTALVNKYDVQYDERESGEFLGCCGTMLWLSLKVMEQLAVAAIKKRPSHPPPPPPD